MSIQYKEQTDEKDIKGTYAFVSLGCPKNTVDSERMLGLLKLDGYQLVADPVGSDFVVVNTCGFIEAAREESFRAIDEMLDLKQKGDTRGVIVSGCLAERQKEQLLIDRPGIDSLVGVFGREEITSIADRLVGDLEEQRLVFQPAPVRALPDEQRLQITPSHFAYLKISEGCDRLCTFCAIPKMRGKHASKPLEQIVKEANELARAGVRELILVAQDTTYYGRDLYGEPRLTELLRELDQVEGLEWIRLMYFYPMYIDPELCQVIANAKKILPYVDMPLQHINDEMLKRMSRRVNRAKTEELIGIMKENIPELVLRTTFITGFPGETEKHVDELEEFISQSRFSHVGVFTYSLEPDTPAARLHGHLEEDVKQRRRERLMQAQQQVVFDRISSLIGTRQTAILDQPIEGEENVWLGRTMADAPDVDGLIFVTDPTGTGKPGAIMDCEIVTSQGYDLVGVAIDGAR
ncbi:MAG: 30S ribosomal protein S12 methylthiotransferase RimO [Planctomycetota bacterium]|nr:30S ribosomal protein S12 methylthiotransferase RimO [Planctomycetota bacterium]